MEFDKVLDSRVSTRKFVGDSLKDEEIEKLLVAARKAPIAMGQYDTVNLTVIRDEKLLQEISKEYNELKSKEDDSLYGAKTFILFSSSKEELSKYEDAGCILENIALKATDMNLGSVYIRGLVFGLGEDAKYISKLNLPEGFKPVSGIVLGYVEEELEGKNHEIKVNYID